MRILGIVVLSIATLGGVTLMMSALRRGAEMELDRRPEPETATLSGKLLRGGTPDLPDFQHENAGAGASRDRAVDGMSGEGAGSAGDIDWPDSLGSDGRPPAVNGVAVEKLVPLRIVDAARSGGADQAAVVAEWVGEDPGMRWRLVVAAILVGADPETAIAELLALAESLVALDPEAASKIGGALATVLASGHDFPFTGWGDEARLGMIEALLASDAPSTAPGAGAVLAWSLSAVGAGNEVGVQKLADLARFHEDPFVRSHAMQNLGKIASVEQILEQVDIRVEPSPLDEARREQQAFLVALLRARGDDVTADEQIGQYFETAIQFWPDTPDGTQSVVHLMHHLALHPVPSLRPYMVELASEDSPSPVLRSLAMRVLERMPVEDE